MSIPFSRIHSSIALGSGSNITGAHLADGTISPRLSDGFPQVAMMTSFIGPGVRRELTAIDLEYLNKIGFVPVPEPATSGLMALTGGLLIFSGRRRPVGKVS